MNATNAISIPIFKYFDTLPAVSLSCDLIIKKAEYKNTKTATAMTIR